MKFLSALYHLIHPPPPPSPRHLSTFLSGYPLQRGEEEGASPLSPSSKRGGVHIRADTRRNRAVSIYRIIRSRADFSPIVSFFFFCPASCPLCAGGGGGQAPVKHARARLTHERGRKKKSKRRFSPKVPTRTERFTRPRGSQRRRCNSSVIGTRLPSPVSRLPSAGRPRRRGAFLFPGDQMTGDIFLSAQTAPTAPSVFGGGRCQKHCSWLRGGDEVVLLAPRRNPAERVGRADSRVASPPRRPPAAGRVRGLRKTRPGRADSGSGAQFGRFFNSRLFSGFHLKMKQRLGAFPSCSTQTPAFVFFSPRRLQTA